MVVLQKSINRIDLTLQMFIHFVIVSDFLPGTGKLYHLSTPAPSSDVRIETGVRQGIF